MDLLKELFMEAKLIDKHTDLENTFESNDEGKVDFPKLLHLILDYKELQEKYIVDDGMPDDAKEIFETIEESKKDYPFIDNLLDSIEIKINDEGEKEYYVKNPPLLRFLRETIGDSEDTTLDIQYIYKNTLYSYCSLIEKIVGKILRDFYTNRDNDSNISKQQISFRQLKAFNDIDEARDFLIDKKIEDFTYGKFKDWFLKLGELLSLKFSESDVVIESIDVLDEMYRVRNLFIHASGEISDRFLIETAMFSDYKKGEQLNINKNQLNLFRKATLNVLIYTVYKYYHLIFKAEKDAYNDQMMVLNNHLVKQVDSDLSIVGRIFNDLKNNTKLSEENKLYMKVNYYIYEYYNGDYQDFSKKIELEFDTSVLDNMYKLAKAILTKNESDTLQYLNKELNDDESLIFYIHDWPLIRIAKSNHESVNQLINQKLNDTLQLRSDEND